MCACTLTLTFTSRKFATDQEGADAFLGCLLRYKYCDDYQIRNQLYNQLQAFYYSVRKFDGSDDDYDIYGLTVDAMFAIARSQPFNWSEAQYGKLSDLHTEVRDMCK